VDGAVDVRGKAGASGVWLLDPNNINISTGANNSISTTNPFVATASANLNTTTLNNALTGGANVIVWTNQGNATSTAITVASPITATGAANLYLVADHGDITVNASSAITAAVGQPLGVHFWANF